MPNQYTEKLPDKATAERLGYTVDTCCYPWVAYKGPRFKPDEFWYVYTDKERHVSMERRCVKAFQEKFGIPMAEEPSLLDRHAFEFRHKFMQEELKEFFDAHEANDLIGAADALIDLVYVVHGTALMMGLPWDDLWAEVQRANMAKTRAVSKDESKRGSKLDVVKPEGWQGPRHEEILGHGPWRMFCTTCTSYGFENSTSGKGCTFCDGTEGGMKNAT